MFKRGTALVPSFLAFAVVSLLEEHFARLVDYDFTAKMEDDLDDIAGARPRPCRGCSGSTSATDGRRPRSCRTDGDHLGGLKELVTDLGEIDAREINSFPLGDGIVLRVGRYGPYVERGEKDAEGHQRADVPDDLAPDELTVELAEELLASRAATASSARTRQRAADRRQGRPLRPYVTEVLPEGTPKTGKNAVKPRTASLFKAMRLDTITLDDALQLLSLPRVVGVDAEGEEITAQNGRYGPYLKKGTDSRSLATEDQLFTVTLDEALAIYAQPKQRGRAAAKPPLRELGADPVSEKPLVVKDGRFGPYVTDGETNATLRRGRRRRGRSRRSAATSCSPRSGPRARPRRRRRRPRPRRRRRRRRRPRRPPRRRRRRKKTAAKKTTAKKTAKKTAASGKAANHRRPARGIAPGRPMNSPGPGEYGPTCGFP